MPASAALVYLFVVSAAGDDTLPHNIVEAINYQPEATEISSRKLNEVLTAEARQAYSIRSSGN